MSDNEHAPDKFPARLKSARNVRGLSQMDLASKAGLPPTSISHFEAGTRKPSFDNLRRLAQVLQVPSDYLLGRIDTIDGGGSSDELYRHVENLTDSDRELAREFLEMLARRSKKRD